LTNIIGFLFFGQEKFMYSAFNLNPRGSSITSDFDQQPNFSLLMVTKKETVADGIFLFELRDPDGAELPAFTPGSHVTVEVPNGSRLAGGIGITPIISMMRHLKNAGVSAFRLCYLRLLPNPTAQG